MKTGMMDNVEGTIEAKHLRGLALIRQRELEELRRLSDEEEREHLEQEERIQQEIDRIKGVVRQPVNHPSDKQTEEAKARERMDSIDVDGQFVLLNPDGSLARVFANLAEACVVYHIRREKLCYLVALRKQLYGKLLLPRSEHYEAWLRGEEITFEPDPDSMKLSKYIDYRALHKERATSDKIRATSGEIQATGVFSDELRATSDEIQDTSDELRAKSYKRAVYCVDTGEYFTSISEAAACKGIGVSCISRSLFHSSYRVAGLQFVPIDGLNKQVDKNRPIGRLATEEELSSPESKKQTYQYNRNGKTSFESFVLVEETGNVYDGSGPLARLFKINNRQLNAIIKNGGVVRGNHLRLLRKEEYERIIPCESYAKEKFDDNVPQPMRRNSKLIKRLDTGKIYASIKDFANAINVTTTCVSASIYNKKFKAKGIPFEVINGVG